MGMFQSLRRSVCGALDTSAEVFETAAAAVSTISISINRSAQLYAKQAVRDAEISYTKETGRQMVRANRICLDMAQRLSDEEYEAWRAGCFEMGIYVPSKDELKERQTKVTQQQSETKEVQGVKVPRKRGAN